MYTLYTSICNLGFSFGLRFACTVYVLRGGSVFRTVQGGLSFDGIAEQSLQLLTELIIFLSVTACVARDAYFVEYRLCFLHF